MIRTKFSGYSADGLRVYPKSSGGGSTTSTSTNINYSPEEAAQRAKVMAEGSTIYGQTKDALANSGFPGAQVAPVSAATTQAQNMMMGNVQAAQPTINAMNNGVQYGMTTAMDVENNPYLRQAVDSAMSAVGQKYTDAGGEFSQIRAGANEAGQYGGSRHGIAEGIAAGRAAGEMADISTNMYTAAYDKGQDTFARTMALAPSALDAMTQPANWMSAVGAQQENVAQQQLDYDAMAREWELNAPWLGLQNYANIVYGAGSGGGTSTGTSTMGSAARNPLMGAVGGGLSGYALGSSIGAIGGPMGAAGGAVLGALMS